jgi:peptide/nickel transport system ATP-binding protein
MTGLEIRDLVVRYERRHSQPVTAVAGASLDVGPGEIVGLVGESGCGKSSVARAAVGLLAPTAGSITLNGEPVVPIGHATRSRQQARLQMVFQDPFSSLNPRRRIAAQLTDTQRTLGIAAGTPAPTRVAELLEMVGMSPTVAGRYPHQLSGGQRQRVAIARALSAEPSVIVLDEPLSALDASAQAQIANLLTTLARELRIGMLLISHDLAIVNQVADRVSVMYLGRVVERGPTGPLWSNPRHPYTEALIGAIPLPDGRHTMPVVLSGEVPNPANPPAGCRFHPRCPRAFEPCGESTPPLISGGPGREQACWLYDQPDVRLSVS